jgi:hypothetical protein
MPSLAYDKPWILPARFENKVERVGVHERSEMRKLIASLQRMVHALALCTLPRRYSFPTFTATCAESVIADTDPGDVR